MVGSEPAKGRTLHPTETTGTAEVIVALIPAPEEAGASVMVAIHQPSRHTGVGGEAVSARALQTLVLAITRRAVMGANAAVEGIKEAHGHGATGGPEQLQMAMDDTDLGAEVAEPAPTGLGGRPSLGKTGSAIGLGQAISGPATVALASPNPASRAHVPAWFPGP